MMSDSNDAQPFAKTLRPPCPLWLTSGTPAKAGGYDSF